MPNITIHLDEETHRRAKVYAATHRTSISDIFREHIRSLTGSDTVDALAGYSRGELTAHDAMDALGIRCIEDLYSETLRAGHALPRPPRMEAQSQAARLSRLIAPARRRA